MTEILPEATPTIENQREFKTLFNRKDLADMIIETKKSLDLNMMDSILHVCQENGYDEADVGAYLRQSHKIKEELRKEGIDLLMIDEDSEE